MRLKMKNFNIMGVHLKIRLLLGGGLDNLQTNFKNEKTKIFFFYNEEFKLGNFNEEFSYL